MPFTLELIHDYAKQLIHKLIHNVWLSIRLNNLIAGPNHLHSLPLSEVNVFVLDVVQVGDELERKKNILSQMVQLCEAKVITVTIFISGMPRIQMVYFLPGTI